jgi:glycosyltransferase involved in cell wall biosynthesis
VPDVSTRRHRLPSSTADPLRIAMLAPPWIAVPPPAYGGIESVVALLCDELVRRGHDVTLFAAPGSRSLARVHALLESPHPDTIGSALHESDHVAAAWDEIERAAAAACPFDLLHDHSGFTALAMAARLALPVVHTLHGPLSDETARFYRRHAHKATLVALSESQLRHAPSEVSAAAIVPNPIAVEDWPPGRKKEGYLLWMGRFDPVKGAHRAIAAARRCGRRLLLAGPVQTGQREYFRQQVEPHLDGERIVYLGEVGGERRKELFAGASGFLMPIRWPEPFGMVMIEALACGTPVIAFPEGAAREIVIDGENGFHAVDEREMAALAGRLQEIDPERCRRSVASRYDVATVAERYEAVYRWALARPQIGSVPVTRHAGSTAHAGRRRQANESSLLRRAGAG